MEATLTAKQVYDHNRYVLKKAEIDERSKRYGKTERGRAVNRLASSQYRKTHGNVKGRTWYQNLKNDPSAYALYLATKRAQNAVHYALRTGAIVKGPCEVCGDVENVQAHHDDYTKPMELHWLCLLHHGETRRQ